MPTAILSRAESFPMASASTGRSYAVSLARPIWPGLTDCPVVIVLDSGITFGTAVESAAFRGAMGALAPAVIVGVGYDADILATIGLRTRDLTPPAPEGKYADMAGMMGTEYGGADGFLAFLLDELVPDVRRRAPEASEKRRVLIGHSFGGLFAIHALMTRPEAFETFVASSPSLWWNDFAVTALAAEFPARVDEGGTRPRLLMTVAAREQDPPVTAPPGMTLEVARARVKDARMVDAARDFAAALAGSPLAELKFVAFEDEDHASVVSAAVGRGITFALTPTPS